MSDQSSPHLSYWIMVGVILGALCGWFLPGVILSIDFIGTLFLNALKIIVFPLVVSTIIVGLTTLGDYRKLGRTTLKTIGLFAITSGIAATAGLVLALLLHPGRGIGAGASPLPIEVMPPQLRSFGDFLASLIPRNLVEAADGGSYIGLVVVSILAGIVLSVRNSRGRTILSFFKDLRDLLLKLLSWVMLVAPLGLGVLVGSVVANNRGSLTDLVAGSAMFMIVVVVGLLFQAILVLPTILRIYGQTSPVEFLGNMLPALWTAFGTASSSATFPATYDSVVGRNNVDERAGSYVLPLSMSLNMNGSALYLAAAAVFVAQAAGISLSIMQYLQLFIGSVIVSMALGGVPNAALWGVVAVASIAGFPREAMAAFSTLLVVDWILDRVRTVVNVTGDGVSAAVIAETFEFKTVGQRGARLAGARTRSERRPSDGRPPRSDSRNDRRSGGRGRDRDRDRDRKTGPTRGRRSDQTPSTERPPAAPAPEPSGQERSSNGNDRDDRRQRRRSDRGPDDTQRDTRRNRGDRDNRRSERSPREDSRRGASESDRQERGRRDSRRENGRPDRERTAPAETPERPETSQPPVEEQRITARLTPIPSDDSQPEREAEAAEEQSSPTPRIRRRELRSRPPRERHRTTEESPAPEPEKAEPEKTEPATPASEPEPVPTAEPRPRPEPRPQAEAARDDEPKPDRVSQDESPTPPERSGESTDDQPAEKHVSYGRKVSRRGRGATAAKKDEPEVGPVKDGDTEPQPEPEDSYSGENIAFGRGKRKRTR